MNDARVMAAQVLPGGAATGAWVAPLYDARGRLIPVVEAPPELWTNALLDMAVVGPVALYAVPSATERWVLTQVVVANFTAATRRLTISSAGTDLFRVVLLSNTSAWLPMYWRFNAGEAVNATLDGAPLAGQFVHVAGRAYKLPA